MSLTEVRRALPRAPPGWNLAKSFSVKPRASSKAIARASPITKAAVDEEVGAKFSGQASLWMGVISAISECLARLESAHFVIEIILTSKRLMCGRRSRSSAVSPENERAMIVSPSEMIPRSPWRAFCELSTTAVEPVELRVAAILWPMLPDLPTPTTTTLPLFDTESARAMTADAKLWSRWSSRD